MPLAKRRGGRRTCHPSTIDPSGGDGCRALWFLVTSGSAETDDLSRYQKFRRDGPKPVPDGAAPLGGDQSERRTRSDSSVAERHRDKMRSLRGFHPHQYRLAAAGLRIGHGLAHVGRRGNRLAVDVEDHIAGLEALRRRCRSDRPASPPRRRRRCGPAPATGRASASRCCGVSRSSGSAPRLPLLRQFAERQSERVLMAVADDAELDRGAGRHRGDPARKAARVIDRIAIDRDDDVAGLDPRPSGPGCRTAARRPARRGHSSCRGSRRSRPVTG